MKRDLVSTVARRWMAIARHTSLAAKKKPNPPKWYVNLFVAEAVSETTHSSIVSVCTQGVDQGAGEQPLVDAQPGYFTGYSKEHGPNGAAWRCKIGTMDYEYTTDITADEECELNPAMARFPDGMTCAVPELSGLAKQTQKNTQDIL